MYLRTWPTKTRLCDLQCNPPLPHLAIPKPASTVFLLALQASLAGITGHAWHAKISQHCILACSARMAGWCDQPFFMSLKEGSDLGQLGPFLVFVQEPWVGSIRCPLTTPGTTDGWSCTCLQNCAFWLVLELYNYCLNIEITSCGSWPGWKITAAWSQSSWDPTNSGAKEGPLSSPGPQRAAPRSSLWVGHRSE